MLALQKQFFKNFFLMGKLFIYVLIVIKFLKLHDIVKFKSEIK